MEPNEDCVTKKMVDEQPLNEEFAFEDIIEEIGSYGKFQQRMNMIFNCLPNFFQSMSSYAAMMALIVPEHWCHVPGRENTTNSIEMWKNLTIPRYNGAFSRCQMYESTEHKNETTDCIYGWDYDNTWFSATAVTQENWVCEREMIPNNVYSISHFIAVPISLLLFYSGDRFGRRKQFLLSISLIAVSRSLLTVSPSVLPLYIAISATSEAAGLPSMESALAVGIELTGIRKRSYVTFLTFLFYCLGTVGTALAAWLFGNWISILLVAALPCFVPLLLNRYLPDSPRWLISKGRPEEALEVLKRIAATNGKPLPPDTARKLHILSQRRTPNMNITSIFTNRNLFKNTVMLVFSRSLSCFVIYTLIFNNKTFGDNPFVSYIGQGFLQLAAAMGAHCVGNRFGRRVSHCLALVTGSAVCILLVIITVFSLQWGSVAGSLFLQLLANASLFLSNLQSMEIHPTCVRQFGVAIEYAGVQGFLSLTPYLSHLGNTTGMEYFFGILAALFLITALLISFVPESVNEKLPETIEDATLYGRDQKYWSLPRRMAPLKGKMDKLKNYKC